MNILFDGHIFRWQRRGGVSRYFAEIISRLPNSINPVLLGVTKPDIPQVSHPRLIASPLCSLRPRRFCQPLKKAFWRVRYLGASDLFHPTYYTLTGGLSFKDVKTPIVITVHDFVKARFPHLEGDSTETIAQQSLAIRHATHLICVSRATELDLLHFHPEAAGRTSVIYHGSSFPILPAPSIGSLFDRPRFLFVGRRETY